MNIDMKSFALADTSNNYNKLLYEVLRRMSIHGQDSLRKIESDSFKLCETFILCDEIGIKLDFGLPIDGINFLVLSIYDNNNENNDTNVIADFIYTYSLCSASDGSDVINRYSDIVPNMRYVRLENARDSVIEFNIDTKNMVHKIISYICYSSYMIGKREQNNKIDTFLSMLNSKV